MKANREPTVILYRVNTENFDCTTRVVSKKKTVRDVDMRAGVDTRSGVELRGVEAIKAVGRKAYCIRVGSLEQSQEWHCDDKDRRRKFAICEHI